MALRVFVTIIVLGQLATGVALAAPAATVNGVTIPYEEYVAALETLPIPGPSGQQQAGAVALMRLISERVIVQFAEKEGVPVTDEQLDLRYKAAQKEGLTDEVLKARNTTEEEVKRGLRAQQAFVNIAMKSTTVTDSEVRDYYFKNGDKYRRPLQIRIGAIITRDKPGIDQAAARLKKGEDFAAVARDVSQDPTTKDSGGSLGWVWPNQPGVPPIITNTALGLKVGAVSRPIKVQDQWVIVKAFERRKPTSTPIEDVRESITETLAIERAMKNTELEKKIREFQQGAAIEIGVDRFKDLAASIKAQSEPGK